MDEPSLIFPAAEYRQRLQRLQGEMADHDLDALLLTTPADIFYMTGFLTRFWESPARPWFIICPRSGDPVAVIPSIGIDLMQRTWVSQIRTWDAPNPEDDGVSLLSDTLCDLLPDTASIGVPMGLETHLRMPLRDYDAVAARIHPRTFLDGTQAIQRVREIKSDAEIDKIRTICQIADRSFAAVPELATAGTPLDHLFSAFQGTLLQEGADWVSYLAGAAGPDGYGDVISPATSSPLAKGDVVMLDTGAVKDGYFCDFDRNYSVGPASDAVRRTHAALWHATEVALERLRPGMAACEAHGLLVRELDRHGVIPTGGRLGHGLGVSLTEWPSLTPSDRTELREGMVLTVEPGAVIAPGRILVHEENLVLRHDGAELLSPRASYEIQEI